MGILDRIGKKEETPPEPVIQDEAERRPAPQVPEEFQPVPNPHPETHDATIDSQGRRVYKPKPTEWDQEPAPAPTAPEPEPVQAHEEPVTPNPTMQEAPVTEAPPGLDEVYKQGFEAGYVHGVKTAKKAAVDAIMDL